MWGCVCEVSSRMQLQIHQRIGPPLSHQAQDSCVIGPAVAVAPWRLPDPLSPVPMQ